MQLAQIQEDEFSRGYRGRLRILNQYPSVLKFMADFRTEVHPEITTDYPAAATLALAAGTPLQQFIKKHSLLPFHRAVSLKNAYVEHGDAANLSLIDYFGTRVWRQTMAMSCVECIREDINKLGFGYWRLTHQLPGIPWCIEHGCQLANSSIGKKAMDSMPSFEVGKSTLYLEEEFQSLWENPVIQRYAAILLAFQKSKQPMPLIHANYRIAKQAKKHDLRVGERGKKPTLTERVMDQVPIYWLKALYPEIEEWTSGKPFRSIDNSTKGLVTSSGYALALAVLFDSSQEALAYWFGDIEGLPTERKAQRSFGKDYWNSDSMFNLYVEHCGSHASMGKVLGIDPSYARLELMAAGFPALGAAGRGTAVKAVLDFHAGMSFDSACQSNGADQEEVERLIRTGISKFAKALGKMR